VPVKGLAHITGGGLTENIPRVLGDHLTARIQRDAWPLPPLFTWLQQQGSIADDEMFRVFNCGIGMVLVVDPSQADETIDLLGAAGETVYRAGKIERRRDGEPQTTVA
jgi:phosphoribosylformylglycinamidine cyclo-ligase